MALHSMPILYFNLCGEMMYVLEQRLKAQNIPVEKTQKVLTDIIVTMLGKKFVAELFQPQELFSRNGFYTLFSKLAHTSIMRLNTTSMDRLFDLMIMAAKQQIVGCFDPTEVLFVTLNHLDGLRAMVGSQAAMDLVTYAHSSFVTYYGPMTYGEMCLIRQALLSYFQDVNIKVALFLREGVQTNNGKFALPFCWDFAEPFQQPGVIRFKDNFEELWTINVKTGKTNSFTVSRELKMTGRVRSTNVGEPRGTKLGLNMYNPENCVFGERKAATPAKPSTPADEFAFATRSDSTLSDSSAGKDVSLDSQLSMMLKLLGTRDTAADTADSNKYLKLNLFDHAHDDEWMRSAESAAASEEAKREKMITLDASKQKKPPELQRLIDDFARVGGPSGRKGPSSGRSAGDDLLELLDSSAK